MIDLIQSEDFRKFLQDSIDKMGEIIGDPNLNYMYAMENSHKLNMGLPNVVPWVDEFFWTKSQINDFKVWFIAEYKVRFDVPEGDHEYSPDNAFDGFIQIYGILETGNNKEKTFTYVKDS